MRRREWLALVTFSLLSTPGKARADEDERPEFRFYYAFDCPHCAKAKPFVKKLGHDNPGVRFSSFEVKKDREGRRRFAKEVQRLGIQKAGVPLFVCGDDYVMGWDARTTKRDVKAMLERCKRAGR